MKLSKTSLTVAAVAAFASFASTLPATAANVDGPKVFWKLSMWGNPRALSAGIEAMAEKVREETGGNFNIKIFYGAQLSKSTENLDGLKVNAFEGAAICNFYHPGKNPAWMVFSLPFLPLGDPQVDKYVRTKMMEHPAIVADMAQWNAVPYISGLLPQYEILGNGDAPTSLEAWEGMRVRAGGGLGTAMEKLGAVKTTLPAGETSTAMQRGALDAAAFPYTYAHVAFKINEESTWFTANLAPGTSECGWVFNKTAYDALPDQYKKLLADNKELALDTQLAAYAAADEKNLPMFKENLTEIVYSDDELAKFKEVAGQPVWDEWVAANKDKFDAQNVLDSVFKFAEEAK
ncbi:MAG: C4-dicarboxylate ABC transporter substrate-binding protein [Lentilitoribacter sp.]|jgi:TRAP-type mannitol/chloroaromatic compound transport system substrate-binding protein